MISVTVTAVLYLLSALPTTLNVTHKCVKTTGNLATTKYKCSTKILPVYMLRGTVVERRSLAGELSLSCARPVADG